MLRNNADVRRCVYFELRLPVVLLCVSRNIPLPCKVPPSLFFFSRKWEKNALLPARDTDLDKYRGHDPQARYRKVSNIVCDKDNSIDLIQTKEQYQCLKYCSYLI